MSTPRPIIPLCMTTSSNGTIYVATFAYWEAQIGTDPNPDYFVVLKGRYRGGIIYDDTTMKYTMTWSAVASIERNAVNIFPGKANSYSCAISPDSTVFVLHVVPDNYTPSIAQVFSVEVPLGKTERDDGFQPIQMILDERLNRTMQSRYKGAYAIVPIQELVPQSSREWVHFLQTSSDNKPFEYALTVNGSLPSQGKDAPQVFNSKYYYSSFAIHNSTFYGFCIQEHNQQSIFSMPLMYNNNAFEQIAQSSARTWSTLSLSFCTLGSAMAINDTVVYMYCDGLVGQLLSLDTLTNTTKQVQIQKNMSKVDWSMPSEFQLSPATLRVLDPKARLLIYHYGAADPSLLYIIDIDSGVMTPMWVEDVPYFSGQNQNRMLSSGSLTLSDVTSLLITIATLLLGLLLIWFQESNEKKRKRMVQNSDVHGSKLAFDANEVSFQEYQRAQAMEFEQGAPYAAPDSFPPPSSSSSPQSAQQTLRVRGSRFGTSYSQSNIDGVDLSDRPSPVLHEQGLESLQFSSHPRPNVVTTIPYA